MLLLLVLTTSAHCHSIGIYLVAYKVEKAYGHSGGFKLDAVGLEGAGPTRWPELPASTVSKLLLDHATPRSFLYRSEFL